MLFLASRNSLLIYELQENMHSNTGGTGLVFGSGLSPFAIICKRHAEVDEVKKMISNASLIESGTAVMVTTWPQVELPSLAGLFTGSGRMVLANKPIPTLPGSHISLNPQRRRLEAHTKGARLPCSLSG